MHQHRLSLFIATKIKSRHSKKHARFSLARLTEINGLKATLSASLVHTEPWSRSTSRSFRA